MADHDRLRHLLTEAESFVMPMVNAPGADATVVALRRRRRRRRAAVSALAALLTLLGFSVAAWSRGPVTPPVDRPLPSQSPDPTASPSEQAQAPATGTPSASVCAPPIKSLDFNVVLDDPEYALPHLRINYRIADDQVICGPFIETWVMSAQREGNTWRVETAALVTFHEPGMTNGMPIRIDDWCGDDQEVWVIVGLNTIPQTWSASREAPVALWQPGRPSGAIRIDEPTEDCDWSSPPPSPTATPSP